MRCNPRSQEMFSEDWEWMRDPETCRWMNSLIDKLNFDDTDSQSSQVRRLGTVFICNIVKVDIEKKVPGGGQGLDLITLVFLEAC